MAKKHFYAIKSDSAADIFTNWEACKAALSDPKYQGNKAHKGFVTEAEALAFISGNKNEHGIYQENLLDKDTTYIYVDGSYNPATGQVGAGMAVVQNFNVIYKQAVPVTNPKLQESHQIGGEVQGSISAIEWAILANIKNITIAYDYAGVEGWAPLGWGQNWKQKALVAQTYRQRLDELKAAHPDLKVTFTKVSSSHSSNAFNDIVDELAKEAAGL